MRQTRLDGFGSLTSNVDRNDAEKMAVLGDLRQVVGPAMAHAQQLLAQAAPTH
jgi:hypothetical protein